MLSGLIAARGYMPKLRKGLVSYWSLDEASGSRYDFAGANTLTDNNTVVSAAGKISNAAVFVTANNEYLSCASNASLQMSGNTDFTISAWVKLTSFPGVFTGYSLVTKDDSGASSRDYTLDCYNGDIVNFPANIPYHGFRFYVQGSSLAATGIDQTAGIWYHLIGWYNSSDGKTRLRVNDTTTYTAPTSVASTDVSTAEFRIGARQRASEPDYSSATIDEVGLWKRILSSSEITQLYNSGNGLAYSAFT